MSAQSVHQILWCGFNEVIKKWPTTKYETTLFQCRKKRLEASSFPLTQSLGPHSISYFQNGWNFRTLYLLLPTPAIFVILGNVASCNKLFNSNRELVAKPMTDTLRWRRVIKNVIVVGFTAMRLVRQATLACVVCNSKVLFLSITEDSAVSVSGDRDGGSWWGHGFVFAFISHWFRFIWLRFYCSRHIIRINH